jgi:RpiB/LacA/LacB family sugar-phosphate isomerase
MKVAVAFDHRGVALRDAVGEALDGHEVIDLGTHSSEHMVDYPDKAREIGEAILGDRAERGILVCGSGAGAAIAACKMAGIRAAICHDLYSAHQAVEHDDMNVLCLGSEIVGASVARELVGVFLAARYEGGGRYAARLEKVAAMERTMKGG